MTRKLRFHWLIPLCVGLILSSSGLPGTGLIFVRASAVLASGGSITIVPDQMTLLGDVSTQANSIGHCTQAWLEGTPPGSILLGVDPQSCQPADWDGASASTDVVLPTPYSPTVYVLKLSWPDRDGKGLHSTQKDSLASISLDGQTIWEKRTAQPGTFGDYYGAQHDAILTTIVVTQPGTHTLTISVPQRTAWDLGSIELTAYPFPSHIQGVGYGPYRDCQYAGGAVQPTVQNLQDDLARMFHVSNAIRTYSSTGVNAQVPALANALGLPVFAGAWLDKNARDEEEIQGLIDLAKNYHLDGVIVGSEFYLRHRLEGDLEYLRQRIVQVKNAIPAGIPVATGELDNWIFDWNNELPTIKPAYRPILDQLDIIMVHIYPFWNGKPIEGAASLTINHYKAIQALIEREYPGGHKRVIIGEAGWPSAGAPNLQAMPSPQNQDRYMREFLTLAEQQGVDYFYFDAFDELWKYERPGRVGQHWGFGYTDRSAKLPYFGVLLPAGQLPAGFPSSFKTYLPLIKTDFSSTPPASTWSVYSDWPEEPRHFVPSGWQGDIDQVGMDECDRSDPYQGEMAIRASFSPSGALGWGGVYWQYPEDNWASSPTAIDLSAMNKLTFWARGALGGEKIRFFVGGIGSQADPYPESLRPGVSTGFVELSTDWQQYTINLVGKDLSHVIGGFGWATDRCASPQGATFFLDAIQYEYDPGLQPPPSPGPLFPVYTDSAAQDNHYFPTLWFGDGATPGRVSISECWSADPHSGTTSIRVAYTQNVLGSAGTFWVDPSGNVGDRPGGYDLRGAQRLTFWARSDTPAAQVKFLVGGVGYDVDYKGNSRCDKRLYDYPDSLCPKIVQPEILNAAWTKYTIDLSQLSQKQLADVVGGFGWSADQPLTFYLDDIIYEFR